MKDFYYEKFKKHSDIELKGCVILFVKKTKLEYIASNILLSLDFNDYVVLYVDVNNCIYAARMDCTDKEKEFLIINDNVISFVDNFKGVVISNLENIKGEYTIKNVRGNKNTYFKNKKAFIEHIKEEGKL